MNLGGWLRWISLMEHLDHVGCIRHMFWWFPTRCSWGVVKSFPFDKVESPDPLQQQSTLLSRIQCTSHLSESSNSIGGGGSMALLGIPLELVGCSSDTWNMGWMQDRARDRPRRNTCDDTFSTIGKGPRKRWSSFLEGRVVQMFRESSQTVSPTLNEGIRRHRDTAWASYSLRVQVIWSRRYRC